MRAIQVRGLERDDKSGKGDQAVQEDKKREAYLGRQLRSKPQERALVLTIFNADRVIEQRNGRRGSQLFPSYYFGDLIETCTEQQYQNG